MDKKINSFNQILPIEEACRYDDPYSKSRTITIIWTILRDIICYQAEHQRMMDVTTTTLQHVLSQEIVINNVHSFLELPSYAFEGEDDEDFESLLVKFFATSINISWKRHSRYCHHNALSFLELPLEVFVGKDDENEEDDSDGNEYIVDEE